MSKEKVFQNFRKSDCTVQVIDKWGEGWHLKYIPLSSGEMIILEADGEPPPFVVMESQKATIAGSAEE